jgi:CRP-like cAMP-binding protein
MWALTARELQRVQEHSLVLIKSAEERVAGFLLEMADRVPTGLAVELPMSRQDIADYLGPHNRNCVTHAPGLGGCSGDRGGKAAPDPAA